MNKVYFTLADFPKLGSSVYTVRDGTWKSLSEILRSDLGFKSAGFDMITGKWYVDDHEYTWLVLRFS